MVLVCRLYEGEGNMRVFLKISTNQLPYFSIWCGRWYLFKKLVFSKTSVIPAKTNSLFLVEIKFITCFGSHKITMLVLGGTLLLDRPYTPFLLTIVLLVTLYFSVASVWIKLPSNFSECLNKSS